MISYLQLPSDPRPLLSLSVLTALLFLQCASSTYPHRSIHCSSTSPPREGAYQLLLIPNHKLISSGLNPSEYDATIECSSESPVHAMRNELISPSLNPLKRAVPTECCSGSPVLAVRYELISIAPDSSERDPSIK